MIWSKEVPITPGVYWWKDEDGETRQFRLARGWQGMMLWYREPYGWVPAPDYGEYGRPIPEPEEAI